MKTKIYGASDDLIEIEGQISEEINTSYEKALNGFKIECSDGTHGKIQYNGDWNIEVVQEGLLFEKVVNGHDEIPHTDEDTKGCSTYSDVLVFREGLEWIKIGRKTFKPLTHVNR